MLICSLDNCSSYIESSIVGFYIVLGEMDDWYLLVTLYVGMDLSVSRPPNINCMELFMVDESFSPLIREPLVLTPRV
jgi:hypothetical protein